MKCIACKHELSPLTVGTITVDACRSGCGGIWFDNFELMKVDEQAETAGDDLLKQIQPSGGVSVDHSARRNCPRCDDMIMMRHFFSPNDKVEVDRCPQCNGIWLDLGELAKVRGNFKTQQEREQATEKFLAAQFNTQFETLRDQSEEESQSTKRIARALRFLCPSYFIPGKQEWGGY